MPFLATGTNLSQEVTFNAGTLDINGLEVATLQDITVSLEVSMKELRQLGSIKMATAPKRYGFKPSAKSKVKTVNKELYGAFLGSSSVDGSGFDFSLLDGQNVLSRASIRVILNESTNQQLEFQFTNAIISGGFALALKTEDFGELDIEIVSQDVTLVTNF